MLQSFFNSLAGMDVFSRALDNISNNIANMNTPGFKGTDVFLRNLNRGGQTGYGVRLEGSQLRLYAGEIRQTGNPTDMAIVGDGYFVLRDQDGALYYTRAGQFSFNDQDKLVESATEYEVLALDDSGRLINIDISEQKVLAPQATQNISLRGNLAASDQTYSLDNVSIYDAAGKAHILNLAFANNQDNSWTVTVRSGEVNLAEFTVGFSVNGSPAAGANRATTQFSIEGQELNVVFSIGDPESFVGATQIGSVSNLSAKTEDGRPAVGLAELAVDESGVIIYKYTNGDDQKGHALALATFASQHELGISKGNLYRLQPGQEVSYGTANSGQFGIVQSGSLELSNVELTQEFADLLVIQRGYQASARVMSVANEMIEQLYNNRG